MSGVKGDGLQGPAEVCKDMEKKNKLIMIGKMDNTKDHTHESANRVYGSKGLCPTIVTCGGGGLQPKVIKRWK